MELLKILQTVKKKIKESKGPLTASGKLVNYTELHAAGLGLLDGFGFHGRGYRLEYWMEKLEDVKKEPHYYEAGYSTGRALKYSGLIGIGLYLYGPEFLTKIVPGPA